MSTLSFNAKSAVSAKQNEEHKRRVKELLTHEGNRTCADCTTKGPRWCSVNLGVFICLEVCPVNPHSSTIPLGKDGHTHSAIFTPPPPPTGPRPPSPALPPPLQCSGVHRSLGTHISQVRSTDMDTWLPDQVAFVESCGNTRANLYWEHSYRDPKPTRCHKQFIENKYQYKRYADPASVPPTITLFKQGRLPSLSPRGGSGYNNGNAKNGPGSTRSTPLTSPSQHATVASPPRPPTTTTTIHDHHRGNHAVDLLGDLDSIFPAPPTANYRTNTAPTTSPHNQDDNDNDDDDDWSNIVFQVIRKKRKKNVNLIITHARHKP